MWEHVTVVWCHSNVFMDGALREMRVRRGDCVAVLKNGKTEWKLPQGLYRDDTVLSAKSGKVKYNGRLVQ